MAAHLPHRQELRAQPLALPLVDAAGGGLHRGGRGGDPAAAGDGRVLRSRQHLPPAHRVRRRLAQAGAGPHPRLLRQPPLVLPDDHGQRDLPRPAGPSPHLGGAAGGSQAPVRDREQRLRGETSLRRRPVLGHSLRPRLRGKPWKILLLHRAAADRRRLPRPVRPVRGSRGDPRARPVVGVPELRGAAEVPRQPAGAQLRAVPRVARAARHAGAGADLRAGIGRAVGAALSGGDRARAAHARLRRLPAPGYPRLSRPGVGDGRDPRQLLGLQGDHRAGGVAPLLPAGGAAGALPALRVDQCRELYCRPGGSELRAGPDRRRRGRLDDPGWRRQGACRG